MGVEGLGRMWTAWGGSGGCNGFGEGVEGLDFV